MQGPIIVARPDDSVPVLNIGRAYSAEDAAAILGIRGSVLNERVREGLLKPIFVQGDRRYSGYVLAGLLGWPLSEDPSDYIPKPERGDGVNGHRKVRRGRSRALA